MHGSADGPSEDETKICSPFLKIPGSTRLRTLPDGLWLNFGGTFRRTIRGYPGDRSLQHNPELLDKRSRFAPSTTP